jgi:hypothetical protein
MSNTTTKFAIALFLVLAPSAASFARGGSAAVGHSGSAAVGTVGGRPNAAELGALGNMSTDPSGIGNASKVAPIPPPRITVPTVPQFK